MPEDDAAPSSASAVAEAGMPEDAPLEARERRRRGPGQPHPAPARDDASEASLPSGTDEEDLAPQAARRTHRATARRALEEVSEGIGMKHNRRGGGGHMDDWDPGIKVSGGVRTTIRAASAAQLNQTIRRKDKSDRATVELVLDPRTMRILSKMAGAGVFSKMYGCVSTGKEANVYTAETSSGSDVAVKIFKTSILVFKDRDRYVSGDYRFRGGYSKNPRKMVAMWAEKEFRNLHRLHQAGIRCPKPLELKLHVLVMEFLGKSGAAAPRIRDARLSQAELREAYLDLLLILRKLYQECRLVHGDLSEYNLLWHEGEVWVIDVSQAVDLDHPHALTFLREDCAHVNAYFRRSGVATLTTRELFEFVVDPTVDDTNQDATLQALMDLASSRPLDLSAEEEVADAVFQHAFIPRRLDEVAAYERDVEDRREGREREIFYQTILGLRDDLTGAQLEPRVLDKAAELTGKDYKDYKLKDADSRGAKDGNEWLYDQAADGGEGFAIPYGKSAHGRVVGPGAVSASASAGHRFVGRRAAKAAAKAGDAPREARGTEARVGAEAVEAVGAAGGGEHSRGDEGGTGHAGDPGAESGAESGASEGEGGEGEGEEGSSALVMTLRDLRVEEGDGGPGEEGSAQDGPLPEGMIVGGAKRAAELCKVWAEYRKKGAAERRGEVGEGEGAERAESSGDGSGGEGMGASEDEDDDGDDDLDDDGSEDESDGSGSDEGGRVAWEGAPGMTREERKAAMKEHKKKVKEENRERRKSKMPKKEKKKVSKARKGRK